MRFHALLAVLAVVLLPALAWGGQPEPPAASPDRPPERFAGNYELVLEFAIPGATAQQTLLLAAPRFQAQLAEATFEGQLTPVGKGKTLLEYEAHVLQAAREGRPAERLRWRASVLLSDGVKTAIVTTHDTAIRATLKPAP